MTVGTRRSGTGGRMRPVSRTREVAEEEAGAWRE